jgi:predicted RNA-binding Zn ribbon-like protein
MLNACFSCRSILPSHRLHRRNRVVTVINKQKALHLQEAVLMKKALLGQEEVFLWRKEGKVGLWDFELEEILEATNTHLERDSVVWLPGDDVLPKLREWINRYFEEGFTDNFLDDLNKAMQKIRYTKIVLPLDLLPSDSGYPRNGYIAELDQMNSQEAYAANEFSKVLTSGMLKRVKRCQMDDCEKLFVGPPQAKWCSKTCGSKYRVRKKRKRDAS